MVLTREETAAIPTLIDSRKFLIEPKKGIMAHVHSDLAPNCLKSTIKRYTDPYSYNKISATIQPN